VGLREKVMGSDVRALGGVFLGGLVVAIVVIGFGVADAFHWMPHQFALAGAFGSFVIGSVVLARRFGPALTGPRGKKEK
jgi:hypothetical protein